MEELKRLSWEEEDLAKHRKGDEAMAKLARRLRAETIMSFKWIAERLRVEAGT